MNPAANVSPAPVGSRTSSSGYAGSANKAPLVEQDRAVLSLLDHERLDALLRELVHRADQVRLPGQGARLVVVEHEPVDRLRAASSSVFACAIQRFIVSRSTNLRAVSWSTTYSWVTGSPFARKTNGWALSAAGSSGRKLASTFRSVLPRRRRVHLAGVRARPPERLRSLAPLEPGQVDAALLEHLEVLAREVVADDARRGSPS